MKEMNIPVGVSDFEEIRKNGYYYIDKSGLIGELLSRTGTKVTLITRPRRFGKTLGILSNEDSVVTGKIPDDEVWAGNPARFIKRIKNELVGERDNE